MDIYDSALQAREYFLQLFDFDIFRDPLFIESFICKLCHLSQTSRSEKWDGVTVDGMRVEIKHSVAVKKGHKTYLNGMVHYFRWDNLNVRKGHKRTKELKPADIFIFVGYDPHEQEKRLRTFIFPRNVVMGRNTLTIILNNRRRINKWIPYEVSILDLPDKLDFLSNHRQIQLELNE